MIRNILVTLILSSLILTACTLDTSGTWAGKAWIDAPLNDAMLIKDTNVAIMGHSNFDTDQIFLVINGTPFIELTVSEVSTSLWESVGFWQPVAAGTYRLRVRAIGMNTVDSSEIHVTVLETRSLPMTAETPQPTPTLPNIEFPIATNTAMSPVSINFWADSYTLVRGGCTMLHWQVEYATGVFLNDEYIPQIGDRQVCPETTTTFNLKVQSPGGEQAQQLIITVTEPPPTVIPPTITPRPPTAVPPPITTPPDNTGPNATELSHSPELIFDGTSCGAVSANISVKVSDPSGISKVEVFYRVKKGSTLGVWRSKVMQNTVGKTFQTSLGYDELHSSLSYYGGGIVEYYVRAWDNRNNMTQSSTQNFEVKICLI